MDRYDTHNRGSRWDRFRDPSIRDGVRGDGASVSSHSSQGGHSSFRARRGPSHGSQHSNVANVTHHTVYAVPWWYTVLLVICFLLGAAGLVFGLLAYFRKQPSNLEGGTGTISVGTIAPSSQSISGKSKPAALAPPTVKFRIPPQGRGLMTEDTTFRDAMILSQHPNLAVRKGDAEYVFIMSEDNQGISINGLIDGNGVLAAHKQDSIPAASFNIHDTEKSLKIQFIEPADTSVTTPTIMTFTDDSVNVNKNLTTEAFLNAKQVVVTRGDQDTGYAVQAPSGFSYFANVILGSDPTLVDATTKAIEDASGNGIGIVHVQKVGEVTISFSTFVGEDSVSGFIGAAMGTDTDHPFGIYANNQLAVSILPSGFVGFQTTVPSAVMHVNGDAIIESFLYVREATLIGTLEAAAAGQMIAESANLTNPWEGVGTGHAAQVQNETVLVSEWIGADNRVGVSGQIGTYSNHSFGIYAGNFDATLIVDVNDRVGIRTGTPTAALDINGDAVVRKQTTLHALSFALSDEEKSGYFVCSTATLVPRSMVKK